MTPEAITLRSGFLVKASNHHSRALGMACEALASLQATFDRLRPAVGHGMLRLPPLSACGAPDGVQEAYDTYEAEAGE